MNNQQKSSLTPNREYKSYRSRFSDELTQHFPDSLMFIENSIICNLNKEKNDVGLMLYEYKVDKKYLEQIMAKIDHQYVAQYKSTDPCLLVVNRFESYETYSNSKQVKVGDTSLIDQTCFEHLYPIPNFVAIKKRIGKGPIWLNSSYTIYVLEAKTNVFFKNFPMDESNQMPTKWKNGFSRGIAISQKEKAVIHWLNIW